MYKLEDLLSESEIKNEPLEIPDYMLNDPEIVGYPDQEMQDEIYQWVLKSIDDIGSIKDFGCGRGDLGYFVDNFGFQSNIVYIGIDQNQFLLDAGRIKYDLSENQFQLVHDDWMNVDIQTDYTVCIGSLNEYREDQYTWFWDTLEHALRNTSKKIIFVFNTDPEDGFSHYRLNRIIDKLDYPFDIDCSKYEGICKLTVYCQKFQI